MPRSIIVVRTVPGTVAAIQSFVANPGLEISSPVAFTAGARHSVQPPWIVHGLTPTNSARSSAAVESLGYRLLDRAFPRGSVDGFCGALYPAWAKVCTGQ